PRIDHVAGRDVVQQLRRLNLVRHRHRRHQAPDLVVLDGRFATVSGDGEDLAVKREVTLIGLRAARRACDGEHPKDKIAAHRYSLQSRVESRESTVDSRQSTVESRESHRDLDWYVWVQLSGMEGKLLPAGSSSREDAAVLRGAVSDGRDQLHLLPHAERKARQRMGGANPVAVQADAEGAA